MIAQSRVFYDDRFVFGVSDYCWHYGGNWHSFQARRLVQGIEQTLLDAAKLDVSCCLVDALSFDRYSRLVCF